MATIRMFEGVRRAGAFGAAVGLISLAAVGAATFVGGDAQAQEEQVKIVAKGRIQGGQDLLNPVWNEAKDPKNHRYTFRQPSTTVGKAAKQLSAYLPKELCIAVLGSGSAPTKGTPVQINVSGGRTTPVTLVVPEGQNVQFVNHDPFPHRLYSVQEGAGALGPEVTKPSGQRTWKPPKVGVYEIRDKSFPSVRSWIVVEPKAVASGYPTVKNEWEIGGLAPGDYELRAYFSGKPVGKPLKISLRPVPEMQTISEPLVISEPKKKEEEEK